VSTGKKKERWEESVLILVVERNVNRKLIHLAL
jgi:hypothetical protein